MSGHAAVIWHDVECGGYREDVALWRALAEEAGGAVLDVGAGTGRITLDLAARGHDVVALDAEPALLAALAERAAERGLAVQTHAADARAFDLGARGGFGLIAVPMQTVQLLGGSEARAAFLRCARAHLRDGGLVAMALADALESFDAESDGLPEPDAAEVDGARWVSLPLAVVDEGERAAIHRLRQVFAPDGSHADSHDVIRLDRLTPDELEDEGRAAGLEPLPARRVPATQEYVGSTVVVLRG
ncbi:MAG TPA: class I SAM-dependent methyltransferase [Baekduia sp.]|nr:class I SAM-dependent methyltransferase [Baekduia sp.]